MIIECSSCKSRFRLDDSKITGRGARVRCRKCGEAITVMKEDVDGQGGSAAAETGGQAEGFDLRSVLRETMETPSTPAQPAAEPAGADALQSDFEKMMADAGKEADAEAAAPRAETPAIEGQAPQEPEGQERPTSVGPTLDFGPEEKITFGEPLRTEPPAMEAPPPQAQETPPPPAAPGSDSGFMMSTSDSLDFLKADYDQKEQKAALDISGSLRITPAPETIAGKGLKAPETPAGRGWPSAAGTGGAGAAAAGPTAGPLSRSEAIRGELAGLGGAGAASAEKAPAAAAPPRGKVAAPSPSPFPPPHEAAAPKPIPAVRRAPAKKSASLKQGQGSQLARPSVVLLLLLFFALAGGGAYLGFTSDGQKIMRGLVPRIESLWLGNGNPASRYEVGNLIGYYETNAKAGKMFIIKGQVTNEGQLRKTGVRVYAALLDAKNTKIGEKTVYAGNVFAGEALRQASREKIEAAMSNPIGGGLANMDIPPGAAVPFMVVFFDAPDGIDSYRLEPRDVD